MVVATLYSNSSHSEISASDRFDVAIADPEIKGPSALLERLLGERYVTSGGVHQAGDRLYFLVPESEATEGDRVLTVIVRPQSKGQGETYGFRRWKRTNVPNRA